MNDGSIDASAAIRVWFRASRIASSSPPRRKSQTPEGDEEHGGERCRDVPQ